MYKYLILLFSVPAFSGPYIEAGLGVPLNPIGGYIQDQYGIFGVGYTHHVDEIASITIGFEHRSLTGSDHGLCQSADGSCSGDNTVEAKLRFEFK